MATLTPLTDYAPVPRVQIDIDIADIHPVTSHITVYKVVDGRTLEVRGAVFRKFDSFLSVMDTEAPFGVPTNYLVESYDPDEGLPLGRYSLGTVTLAVTSTVVQQPLDPQYNVVVRRLEATARELHRQAPGGLVYPDSAVRPSLVSAGPRRGLSDVTLQLWVESDADATRLVQTLGTEDVPQLPVWLVRTPPPIRLPRLFYCFVPDLVEEDIGSGYGTIRFTAKVDEVDPPAPGLAIPALSYEDLDAAFSTYALRDAAYPSYAAGDSDWSLAGLVP